jgi:predicted nuclease of predicted toxin-antitoxin system
VKILLDECIDRRLARELVDYEVKIVPQMSWAAKKNGELMRLAEAEFDVFITVDRNLSFQQNLPKYNIAVLVLRAKSNRLADLQPFITKIVEVLPDLQKGKAEIISL